MPTVPLSPVSYAYEKSKDFTSCTREYEMIEVGTFMSALSTYFSLRQKVYTVRKSLDFFNDCIVFVYVCTSFWTLMLFFIV